MSRKPFPGVTLDVMNAKTITAVQMTEQITAAIKAAKKSHFICRVALSSRNFVKVDNQKTTAYNSSMGSLGQPTPVAEERDSSRLIIGIAVAVVIAGALAAAFLLREPPKIAKTASPYIANLKLSDFKMSAAENFVGHTISYVDGTITNTGDKTATHVMVEVVFKDDMGQLVQREDLPLQVIRTNGVYTEPVDLAASPLAPGQAQTFRLTFDSISAQWNRQYPEISVTDVTLK